jgi:hypothetical protein
VNVLSSRLMLVVSVGPRPANSRPANPTREYEPGSGDSHDPAPAHHPPPARSPPAVVSSLSGRAGAYEAAPPASRVLRIANATGLRPALDPGASTTPGAATTGRPTTCPRGHRRTPKTRTRQPPRRGPRSPPADLRSTHLPKNRAGQQEKPQHSTTNRSINTPRG